MPLKRVDGSQVVVLRGSPREMGREHGKLLRDQIHLGVYKFLGKSLEIFQVPRDYIVEQARVCERFIPERYLDELDGIAETSGVPYLELLALNCLVDLDVVYTEQQMHCCNFVVAPPATSGGLLMHGRNLDFPHQGIIQQAASTIIRIPSGDALPTVSIAWAGFVGTLTGYNAARLTAAEVTSPAGDNTIEGMPITFLLRHALESAACLEEFAASLKTAQRTAGFNVASCDGKTSDAVCIEITRRSCKTRPMRNGMLVVDNPRLCSHRKGFPLTYPEGAFRHARVMQLLTQNHGRIDRELAMSLLRDNYDLARGMPHGKGGHWCICNAYTVQSVLFLPNNDRLLIAHDHIPAPDGTYIELQPSSFW